MLFDAANNLEGWNFTFSDVPVIHNSMKKIRSRYEMEASWRQMNWKAKCEMNRWADA